MPRFPTPLSQSPRSDILEWRPAPPHGQFVLTGRSRAAWHTSFVVPQLDLLLDAGLIPVSRLRPRHVFLTHGHSDHTMLSPAFVSYHDPPDVHCPVEMAGVFDDFILANTMLNLGGLVGRDDPPRSKRYFARMAEEAAAEVAAAAQAVASEVGAVEAEAMGNEADAASELSSAPSDATSAHVPSRSHWLNTHVTVGMRPGDVVPLRHLKKGSGTVITATAVACDHTVPSLGYVFCSHHKRLRKEFQGLPPMELRRLKVEQGVEITEMVEAPILAFMGDTTAAIFKKVDDGCIGGGGQGQEAAEEGVPPPPAAQGSMVEWLKKGVPVVITECSFLYEEDRDRAVKTKHTIWADLEPVVRKWKDTTFVLMHFSLRYKDWEVRNFFLNLPDPPDNIVLWVDGHMDGEQG